MFSKICVLFTAITMLLLTGLSNGWAEPTPPIMPQITETPLPPLVSLPVPETIPADVPNTPLSAAEAASIALQYQTSITIAKMGVSAAQGRLQQAKAGLMPTLGISGGYTDQPIFPTGSRGANGFSANASLKQLLFDYQHTRDAVRQATAQQQAAQANLTRAQSDLVFQVKQAFYTYRQARLLIDVGENNLRNSQAHVAIAQARVKAGIGLPIDVVRAETAVAEAILNLNLSRNSASLAGVSLALVMGLDPRTPIMIDEADENPIPNDDVNALTKTALTQRPEILQGLANLQAARYAINAAKTSNAPTLVGSVGYGLQGNNFPPTSDTLTLALAVQWNALDGGSSAGKVMEAKANQQITQAQQQATILSVMTDVAQAYLNEKTAEQRLVTAKAEVTNALEAVRLAQGRYSAGLGIFLDVLDAQATLVTAQTNVVNAQTSINQARAALAHALNGDPVLASQPQK